MCARKYVNVLSILAVLVMPFSAATADITTGLVSHWMLDDGVGVVATDSVGGNDGTLQGDATWAEGYIGGAVLLDGDGDFVNCGNKDAFNITDAVTIAAWVQADGDFSYPDWGGIMMRGGPNIDTFAFYYNRPNEQLGFKTTGTTPPWHATPNQAATALFDGEWHHVAATYDGAMKFVYLDGAEVSSVASTGQIETSNGRLLLGAGRDLNPPTHYVAGRLDDERLYDRALSADDIKELMPPKLQAYGPEPADGATGVATPLFRWTAGDTAMFHNIYLGIDPDLGEDDLAATNQPLAMYWYAPGIDPGVTYFWRVDEVEIDGTTVHTGNVWSFITQALTAYHPTPADAATDVSAAPTLLWLPGQATIEHQVYFSDSADAVTQGTPEADKGGMEEPTFAPGALDNVTTYYWRVDELTAGGEVKTGPVWSFTTVLPIEDFESYTDEEGSRIYETWIDGWTNDTGAQVGYLEAPFAETTVVYDGGQSMPFDYNNVDAPFYSEAEREFATGQDWTAGGVDTLVLHVRGRGVNEDAPLYAVVQDTSNHKATVTYSDLAVTIGKWTEWEIPMSELTAAGVNMARVKRITLGVGDNANPSSGGAGLIFVDGIYATRSEATE